MPETQPKINKTLRGSRFRCRQGVNFAVPLTAASAVLGGPSTSQFCQAFAHFDATVLARTQRSVRQASSASPTDDMRQTQVEIQENMRQDAEDLAATVPFAPPDIKPDVIKDVEQFQHMASSDSTPIDEQPAYHINAWVHTHCG